MPGYEIDRYIGGGGTSHVWAGCCSADGGARAIKIVAADASEHAIREFAVLQDLAVDHVVRLHETISLPGGRIALVLDLAEGGSLADTVSARGHLSAGETVTVLAPVARAVAGLHATGIVHGDLTPGNVLLDLSGRPVVADLGVSRLVGEAPGPTFGTDGWTPPEVEAGGDPVAASDVHALGVLGWYCLTGAIPALAPARKDLAELIHAPVPVPLVEVIRRCLAADPADRPSAADVATAVFDAAEPEPIRLVVGESAVRGLTRRIREGSRGEPAGPGRWWDDPVPTVEVPMTRRERRRAERARTRRAESSGPPSAARRVVSGRAAILVASVMLVGAAAVPWDRVASRAEATPAVAPPGAASAEAPSPASPPASGPPSTGRSSAQPRGTVPALSDRSAPRRRPGAVIAALARLRAEAMNAGSPEMLARTTVDGSPAARTDRALLRRLDRTGTRYSGVAFTVDASRAIRGPAGGRATVTAVVATAAHARLGADGTRETVRAEPGRRLTFELRFDDGAWRISAIR